MKKAQIKSILLFMLLTLFCAVTVIALTVTLNSPTSTWETSGSSNFNFTPSAEVNPLPSCSIYTNATGTWQIDANYTNVPNGTDYTRGLGLGDSVGLTVIWNVECDNGSDLVSDSANNTFGVDANLPSITLDSPSNGEYLDNNVENITFTPTDASNPEDCDIWTNFTGSWIINTSLSSFTSLVSYGVNITGLVDGGYMWNVICNQTSTDAVWAETGGNYSFVVDTVNPGDIKLISPTNNTISTNTTPTIKWNLTTDSNFEKYSVYISTDLASLDSSAVQLIETTTIIENATTLTTALASDEQYYIWVRASDLAGNIKNTSDVFYYKTDSTTLSVTLNLPINNTYSSSANVDFNVTVEDDNPHSCWVYLSNSSRGSLRLNYTDYSITNGSVNRINISGLNEGNYTYNIGCNDTVNNKVNASSTLLDLTVDTTAPTTLNLTITFGQTNSTDSTPNMRWTQPVENNFDKYVVEAYNLTYVLIQQINVTGISNTNVNMNLTANYSYTFNVTAYDLAGNLVRDGNTSTQSLYYVDPICGTLYAGWNVCGIVTTTNRNLSVIGDETSATMLAVWNSTHQWQTCVYGVSDTNCDTLVGVDSLNYTAVWIYMDSETLWENRTWGATKASANLTVSNTTVGWNLFGLTVRNGLDFEDLNMSTRLGVYNITGYSFRDNIAGTYTPYITISGYSDINDETNVDFGEALWIYYNETGSHKFDVGGW